MNRDLFWKLLEPEHRRAEQFCRKLTGNVEDGDDLYQEALLAALRKFESLRDPDAFRPWLYRTIVTRFQNRFRSARWRRHSELTDDILSTRFGSDPSGRHTARRWLEVGFTAVKPEEKALILLFEIEGWKVSELAKMFHKPEGTIKARLARTRGKMRQAIETYLSRNKKQNATSEVGYAIPKSELQSE